MTFPPDGYEGLWRLAEGVFRWEGKFAVPGRVYSGVVRHDSPQEHLESTRISVWLKNPVAGQPEDRWLWVWLEELVEAETPYA